MFEHVRGIKDGRCLGQTRFQRENLLSCSYYVIFFCVVWYNALLPSCFPILLIGLSYFRCKLSSLIKFTSYHSDMRVQHRAYNKTKLKLHSLQEIGEKKLDWTKLYTTTERKDAFIMLTSDKYITTLNNIPLYGSELKALDQSYPKPLYKCQYVVHASLLQ